MRRTQLFTALALAFALALLASGCGKTQRITGSDASRMGLGATASGPVAEAIPAGIPTQTATLLAGQTMPIGEVTLWLEGNTLGVRYRVNAPWNLRVTHLAVAASAEDLPVNPAGQPQVGQFPWSETHAPGVLEHTEWIDLAALGLATAATAEIAAQADLAQWSGAGDLLAAEGAWAEGTQFVHAVQAGKGKDKGQGSWAMHFSVDLTTLRGLVLWNKLGSRWEVEHSVVGPNGVIDGALSYPAGKYGNGFEPRPRTGDPNTPANFIDFPGLALGPRGTIEYWYWPNWNDWRVGHIVEVFYFGVLGVGGYQLAMGYNDWQDFEGCGIYDTQGLGPSVGMNVRPSATPQWTTSEPFHVAIVWDGSEAAPTERLKVYFNAVRVGNMYAYGDPRFTGWNPAAVLRMGSRLASGDWYRHMWEGGHGIVDNLKVWNYPKTDFSDRFVE